jgi:hypothetical protein
MSNPKRAWNVEYIQVNDSGPSFRRGSVNVDDADDDAPGCEEATSENSKKRVYVYHPVPSDSDESDRSLAFELCEAWLRKNKYPNASFSG